MEIHSFNLPVIAAAENNRNGNQLTEKESTNQIFTSLSGLRSKETWYPTLKTTVWVLSQLHDFVKVRQITSEHGNIYTCLK